MYQIHPVCILIIQKLCKKYSVYYVVCLQSDCCESSECTINALRCEQSDEKKKEKKIKHNILRANGSFHYVREMKNVLTNFNVCFGSAYVRQTNRFVFTAPNRFVFTSRLTVFTNRQRVTVGTLYTHIIIINV